MNRAQVLSLFEGLVSWSRAGERAPHKPLLVLLALGEWVRGNYSVRFSDLVKPLTELLRDFGPSRATDHPEYPFWRLQKDGVWEVTGSSAIQVGRSGDASKRELIR